MLQYFATGKNGLLTTPDHQQDTSYWINVERPTIDEIDQLVDQFDLPRDYLTAVLDDAEVSRTEQLSATDDDQPVLIVMQYPRLTTSDLGYLEFQVYPFALILVDQVVLTVSNYSASFIQDFVMDPESSKLSLDNHEDFVLAIMWYIEHSFVTALNLINKRTTTLESHLNQATHNAELFRIMSYQKSLIRFKATLQQNGPTLDAIESSVGYFTAAHHQSLTADIKIETQQARDMTDTTNQILQQYSQLVGSVISNNLNDVMKFLTSLTMVLTIPTIIGGIYGMNVKLPGASLVHAFTWIMAGTIVLCIISIEYLRNHDYF
ncbi:magnesium transporter CorA family protein [Lactiplantibacillus pentosus]|uniref:magnesium transporter CorA family protein n=1 Tax=Lactiplantibacillus pentosus TaxID=1589 RepID=UPI001C1F54BC|nr:magnesium transporter CorA family protein [Lactiplantibacillus pentosus]MBU7503306.1 magnesium transporter CorA family protein [Lactiplantibacillus pentosus]MDY1545486.1 magnesium transporter CorA family protein [Lactiplantibacillus pentosus]